MALMQLVRVHDVLPAPQPMNMRTSIEVMWSAGRCGLAGHGLLASYKALGVLYHSLVGRLQGAVVGRWPALRGGLRGVWAFPR